LFFLKSFPETIFHGWNCDLPKVQELEDWTCIIWTIWWNTYSSCSEIGIDTVMCGKHLNSLWG
jgi:hypothetical protein